MRDVLEALKEQIYSEIKKVTDKKDITATELENMNKAVCVLDKLSDLEMKEEVGDYYSNDYGYSSRRGRSSVTGRYVSRSGGSYDYYHPDSMDRGYSGHSIQDRMIAHLEDIVDSEAKNEYERKKAAELISQLQNMR